MLHDIESQTLQDKAVALETYLNNPEWLKVIGIGSDDDGRPCIFVYVSKLKIARALIPSIWCDVPVKVRRLGKLSPAKSV